MRKAQKQQESSSGAAGIIEQWLLRRESHDDRTRHRLLDLINLLAVFLTDDEQRRTMAAVMALTAIDHRLARVALSAGLRSGQPTVEHAAAGALLQTAQGRRILHELRPLSSVAGSALSADLPAPEPKPTVNAPDPRWDKAHRQQPALR